MQTAGAGENGDLSRLPAGMPPGGRGRGKIMRKRTAAVWLLTAALLLAGCGAGFDAAAYVRGILNNLYLGDPSEYVETAEVSEEEAAREYEQGIELETDYFLQYYGIGEITDGVRQQISDMYRQIYGRSKYEVLEAVSDGKDYLVEVQISPIDVITDSRADIDAAVEAFVLEAVPADYEDDRALNDALALLVVDVVTENLPDSGWQEPRSVIVKVEKGEDGYYRLDSTAISQLDQEIIAY